MDQPEWRPDDALTAALDFLFVGHLVGIKPDARQQAIVRLSPGERIQVVHDAADAYRSNHCLVLNLRGEQIGVVPTEHATEIADALDRGEHLHGYVADVFYDHRATYGGGMEITLSAAGVESETPARYGVNVYIGRPRTPAAQPRVPADWHPDPTGRHQWRYWDGSTWTNHVSGNGADSTDSL
jgi:Protein of unknown function (DUF2510)